MSTRPPQGIERLEALAAVARKHIPAYRQIYARMPDGAAVGTLPVVDKKTLVHPFEMAERCLEGTISSIQTIHVSSGSSGQATCWGRTKEDELAIVPLFSRILHSLGAAPARKTLAMVVFPMGSWVGGLFTTMCLRHYTEASSVSLTTVTPGNAMPEILRLIPLLCPLFDQTILLGYPPFVKSVVDQAVALALPLPSYGLRFVFAGEVFSQEWRHLLAKRAGCLETHIVSMYGTADAGVLAHETPLSIAIRSFLAQNPPIALQLFGKNRIPSFFQYDPLARFLETLDEQDAATGTVNKRIVLTTMPLVGRDQDIQEAIRRINMPLIRYNIGDEGDVMDFAKLMAFLHDHGFPVETVLQETPHEMLPFCWVFGRSFWAVSFYGCNVYVENIMVGLEMPSVAPLVTGKFVLSVGADRDQDVRLAVHIELAPTVHTDSPGLEALLASSILEQLCRLNAEFVAYVPKEKQPPLVHLHVFGDEQHFPIGVKHVYVK
ncbi:hypothetical protein HDU91_003221 [Kappamyces sp. JEL0680]|nr:hypothetical protein HDU91_003221 [Kappamyces sp. JEL0680]